VGRAQRGSTAPIYAKCIAGQEEAAKKRITVALGSIGPAA
jgi:hypothetical protein